MCEYEKMKEESIEFFSGSIEFPLEGYKMCFEVPSNGYDEAKSSHPSVHLELLMDHMIGVRTGLFWEQ